MSEKYKPVEGDRVRVVIEGDVVYTGTSDYFRLDGHTEVWPKDKGIVSIEKVEPPVETFEAGAVVRFKASGAVYLVTAEGVVTIESDLSNPGDRFDGSVPTSEHYERIVL